MSYGSKLKYIRNARKLTMQELGEKAGFKEENASARVSHYEMGNKKPKDDINDTFANILGVEPSYLKDQDIEYTLGAIQSLFEFDRIYSLDVNYNEQAEDLTFKIHNGSNNSRMLKSFLTEWSYVQKSYKDGRITKEQYEDWKFNYPSSSVFKPYIVQHNDAEKDILSIRKDYEKLFGKFIIPDYEANILIDKIFNADEETQKQFLDTINYFMDVAKKSKD